MSTNRKPTLAALVSGFRSNRGLSEQQLSQVLKTVRADTIKAIEAGKFESIRAEAAEHLLQRFSSAGIL